MNKAVKQLTITKIGTTSKSPPEYPEVLQGFIAGFFCFNPFHDTGLFL